MSTKNGRENRRRRQQRLRMQRIRAAAALAAAAVIAAVILFATPIFNIRSISVSGNSVVTLDQINDCIGDTVGKNLFATWSSSIEKRLKTIAYIDEAEVSKSLIPPMLYVSIKECETAAYFEFEGKQVILNSDLKVLDDSNTFPLDGVPLIRGIEPKGYTVGRTFELEDAEKESALSIFLKTMSDTGQLGNVLYLDLTSITDIKFSYRGMIDVSCGSALEFDKKLRMFKAVITSGSIGENARGEIDLSNPEQAVYTQ